MAKLARLTQTKINSLKAVGKYADGGGLYLVVRRPGDRYWCFRYMVNGRARQLGLGPLHAVSLAEARERMRQARQVILDGRDPIDAKRAELAARVVEQAHTLTFREAAERFLATDKIESLKNDEHRAQWRLTLEAYAFPAFGDLPLKQVDSAVILNALLPVWKRTPETGSRLRARIERVFAWAMPLKLFEGDNPASRDALKDHLPAKRKVESHKAMPVDALPRFMSALRDRDSLSARALEFSILTAARTSETIGATWAEIDLKAATWTIRAERMKAGQEHVVPLSPRAIELLRGLDISGERIFNLSNMAMLELLRGAAGNGYTVHGFRSTFRDWAGDRTAFDRQTIEFALAHKLPDKVEAAYRRSTALEKRRRLMEAWARHCESTPAPDSGKVVSLRR
jgi:integrase